MGQPSTDWFRLSSEHTSTGVFCSEDGLFVGGVPLLQRVHEANNDQWHPRDTPDLNDDLSLCFGLPIECAHKIAGLIAVARALNKGNLARAQVATLLLRIPDPPPLAKFAQSPTDTASLARQLQMSGLLKADWNSSKHPRWPAGTSGGIGGEFAPADSETDTGDSGASLIQVQEAIPMPFPPFEFIFPRLIPKIGPLPSEIVPPPLVIPQAIPREMPTNPYPNKRKCVKEWAAAQKFCKDLLQNGKLGKGDDRRNRGFGAWMSQCLKGQVSAECGGNSTNAFDMIA